MTTEAQDELVAEMERFARLCDRLAGDIRRLTANLKKDLDDCLALARPEDEDVGPD
jgi:cytochrome c556